MRAQASRGCDHLVAEESPFVGLEPIGRLRQAQLPAQLSERDIELERLAIRELGEQPGRTDRDPHTGEPPDFVSSTEVSSTTGVSIGKNPNRSNPRRIVSSMS